MNGNQLFDIAFYLTLYLSNQYMGFTSYMFHHVHQKIVKDGKVLLCNFDSITTLHPLNPWPLASFFSENTQALPQSITIKPQMNLTLQDPQDPQSLNPCSRVVLLDLLIGPDKSGYCRSFLTQIIIVDSDGI